LLVISLKFQRVISENKERYILTDSKGEPVWPVLKYIKYKDYGGSPEQFTSVLPPLKVILRISRTRTKSLQ